jgi:hypothetical protein
MRRPSRAIDGPSDDAGVDAFHSSVTRPPSSFQMLSLVPSTTRRAGSHLRTVGMNRCAVVNEMGRALEIRSDRRRHGSRPQRFPSGSRPLPPPGGHRCSAESDVKPSTPEVQPPMVPVRSTSTNMDPRSGSVAIPREVQATYADSGTRDTATTAS